MLQPAYRRGDTFQSVYAKLDSAGDFEPFKDALTADPRLDVMVESVVLCVAGGVIGGFLAYAGFNGYQTATINGRTFSQVAFAFAVTPALLVQGAIIGVVEFRTSWRETP